MSDYHRKIGTKDKPLELKTPPGTASATATGCYWVVKMRNRKRMMELSNIELAPKTIQLAAGTA